jgi:hypothetical protein
LQAAFLVDALMEQKDDAWDIEAAGGNELVGKPVELGICHRDYS